MKIKISHTCTRRNHIRIHFRKDAHATPEGHLLKSSRVEYCSGFCQVVGKSVDFKQLFLPTLSNLLSITSLTSMNRIASEELEMGALAVFAHQWKILYVQMLGNALRYLPWRGEN